MKSYAAWSKIFVGASGVLWFILGAITGTIVYALYESKNEIKHQSDTVEAAEDAVNITFVNQSSEHVNVGVFLSNERVISGSLSAHSDLTLPIYTGEFALSDFPLQMRVLVLDTRNEIVHNEQYINQVRNGRPHDRVFSWLIEDDASSISVRPFGVLQVTP